MADVNDVADFLIDLYMDSEDPMTNIRLNKFLYFIQGWHLAIFDKPIFEEDFQAWKKGPVIPMIYHNYKNQMPIQEILNSGYMENLSDEEIGLIVDVARKYQGYSNQALVGMTHFNGSPWKQVYREDEYETVIPKEIIKDYFKKESMANGLKRFDYDNIETIGYFDDEGYTVLPRELDD